MELKNLVEFIVKALVDNPDSVDVREIAGELSSLIEIRVARSDVGMVIGKEGTIAAALRTILGGAAAKQKKRCILDIIE
ncbi:MAG: KH domain-containing protein [Proteobacteria bacterium]|nr:KH domain-containing protein [Pseudomonadota bacterium]